LVAVPTWPHAWSVGANTIVPREPGGFGPSEGTGERVAAEIDGTFAQPDAGTDVRANSCPDVHANIHADVAHSCADRDADACADVDSYSCDHIADLDAHSCCNI
jgi:hypothetical protein